MTSDYTIKRVGNKGNYRLIGLEKVENLDVFLNEVDEATRLWIEDLKVFATSQPKQSPGDYIRFKCEIDVDHQMRPTQVLLFYGKKVKSLALAVERVLSLPDVCQDRSVEFLGLAGGTSKNLIFLPAQLEKLLTLHATRSYMFTCFDLSPQQAILLARHNLEGVRFCSISDKGEALVKYLEHNNDKRTFGAYMHQFNNAWNNIVTFLTRAPCPIFEELLFDPCHNTNAGCNAFIVQANVKSIAITLSPIITRTRKASFEPLLHALYDGTLVAPKLRVCFDTHDRNQGIFLDFYTIAVQALFVAMSSRKCQLKELHLQLSDVADEHTLDFIVEKCLMPMLQQNKSLETLGIDVLDQLLLNTIANHPRLRNIVHAPFEEPTLREYGFLREWYPQNPSHHIWFEHMTTILPHEGRRVVTECPVKEWRKFVFFCQFKRLRHVNNERARSHLLVTALANHSDAPQQIYFLLRGNQDLLA